MINCDLLPPRSNLPEKLLKNYREELLTKIHILLLNTFADEALSEEELMLKRNFVYKDKRLTAPLLPLEKNLLPSVTIEYIRNLKHNYCLDDKSELGQLWVVDVCTQLKKTYKYLLDCKHVGVSSEEVKNLRNDFAGLSIVFNLLSRQTSFKKTHRSVIKNLTLRYQDQFIFLVKTIDKVNSLVKKVSNANEVAKRLSLSIKDEALKTQFMEIQKRAELVEKSLLNVSDILGIGLSLYGNTHYYRYLHGIELGTLVSKNEAVDFNDENVTKINQYVKSCRRCWKIAAKRNMIGLSTYHLLKSNDFPNVETLKSFDNKNIIRISEDFKTKLFNLHSSHEELTQLFFRSVKKNITWLEIKEEWSKIDKEVPIILDDKKEDELRPPIEWLSEGVACYSLTNTQLMTIYRMFENVICKNRIENYVSFDELCNRLVNNFKNAFNAEKKNCPVVIHQNSNKPMDILIRNFSNDISEINRQFEVKIHAELPPREFIDYCIFKFSLLKDSLISKETLLPFRPAVIFVATSFLPAIKKAHKWLFKRFKKSLKEISTNNLKSQKNFLIKRLQGLCLIKMKPLLELLVTIRDIHAVLLDQEECSKEMKEGLHLIPEEFANLLQPAEIAQLIELYIKNGAEKKSTHVVEIVEEKISSEESELEIDFEYEKYEETKELPALHNISSLTTTTILDTLSFKIQMGEKRSKILKRLNDLGAYKLRNGKGSHEIWAHENTDVTMTIPKGDDLSPGVAKNLEYWVNFDIFSNQA